MRKGETSFLGVVFRQAKGVGWSWCMAGNETLTPIHPLQYTPVSAGVDEVKARLVVSPSAFIVKVIDKDGTRVLGTL